MKRQCSICKLPAYPENTKGISHGFHLSCWKQEYAHLFTEGEIEEIAEEVKNDPNLIPEEEK